MLAPYPPLPLNELSRQGLVDAHPCLVEGNSDAFLDEVVQIAARYFAAPICLITIVDRKRQWFRARAGTDLQQTPRADSFCAYSVAISESVEVCDAQQDERFRDNPLVTGEPGIRYYAGVPLILANGLVLGNLCVIDTQPRAPMPAADMAILQQLGHMACQRLDAMCAATVIDSATGLYNHARLDQDLRAATERGESPLAVAIDLLSPAQLNDLLAACGASWLSNFTGALANTLQRLLPAGWTLYRVGVLRFACLVPGDQQAQAETIFAGLIEALGKPLPGKALPLQPQLGIGVLPLQPSVLADDWLRLVASAADAARVSGQGWAYCQAQQRASRVLDDLAEALRADDQLRLVYQPRVDLHTGACLSVTALLRWQHPTLGEIRPAEFVALAEQTPLIHTVSCWVINQAIRQIDAWRRDGVELRVVIKLSAADLYSEQLTDEILRLLARNGLSGTCLEVELTQRALLGDLVMPTTQLERLRAAGVDIALDDFGSDQGAPSYLHDIAANTVKLDSAITNQLQPGSRQSSTARGLISLAKALGQRVVAQGVESGHSLRMIRECGCQDAQGFYISPPLEVDELLAWLDRWAFAPSSSERA